MEKRAHGVLRGKMGRIKESNVDPAWLAGKLLAAGVIGDSDVEKASNDRELSANRLGELVGIVMRNGAPGVFQTFVQTLLDRVDVKWLGEELKGRALKVADLLHVQCQRVVSSELWMTALGRVTCILYFILQRSSLKVVAFGVKCLPNVHPEQVSQVCSSVNSE